MTGIIISPSGQSIAVVVATNFSGSQKSARFDEFHNAALYGVWRAEQSYNPESAATLKTWSFLLAKCECIDMVRREKSRSVPAVQMPRVPDGDGEFDEYQPADYREQQPGEQLESVAAAELWKRVRDRLDVQDYFILRFRFRHGLTYRDIGRRFGMNQQLARQRAVRSLDILRGALPAESWA